MTRFRGVGDLAPLVASEPASDWSGLSVLDVPILVGVLDSPAICFQYSLSSKILTLPPPGLWDTLFKEPTLLEAFE